MKVISGGQTGVDVLALEIAKELGIETGGWMPYGFMTEDGPKPEMADLYVVREYPRSGYPPRTKQNVEDADLTIWYGTTDSPGFRCTKHACFNGKKIYPFLVNAVPDYVIEHLIRLNVKTLNVAGNRASQLGVLRSQRAKDDLTYIFQQWLLKVNRK